jgi:hypothetical protein
VHSGTPSAVQLAIFSPANALPVMCNLNVMVVCNITGTFHCASRSRRAKVPVVTYSPPEAPVPHTSDNTRYLVLTARDDDSKSHQEVGMVHVEQLSSVRSHPSG